MFAIHIVISCSRNCTSSNGSCSPGLHTLPSESVPPEASTMWIKASAFLISSRNWFPNPLPCHAPGTRPAQSISSAGMSLIPLRHRELTGLSWTLNSLHAHGVRTYPIPLFGFIVVNGWLAILAGARVVALKNVDFPVFGFPTIPTIKAVFSSSLRLEHHVNETSALTSYPV